MQQSIYLLKWCPLEDELLTHATWLDFEGRLEKSFNYLEYFICKYPELLSGMDVDWVAAVIMTIPHSGEERIFSLIRKNKTPDTSSLRLDGKISSLMVVKTYVC